MKVFGNWNLQRYLWYQSGTWNHDGHWSSQHTPLFLPTSLFLAPFSRILPHPHHYLHTMTLPYFPLVWMINFNDSNFAQFLWQASYKTTSLRANTILSKKSFLSKHTIHCPVGLPCLVQWPAPGSSQQLEHSPLSHRLSYRLTTQCFKLSHCRQKHD